MSTLRVIHLTRKPLIGTVAKTTLKYGTGALNIDASRIHLGPSDSPTTSTDPKWPANFILEHDPNCTYKEGCWTCAAGCPLHDLLEQGGSHEYFLNIRP